MGLIWRDVTAQAANRTLRAKAFKNEKLARRCPNAKKLAK
jgi:hypothetical protein